MKWDKSDANFRRCLQRLPSEHSKVRGLDADKRFVVWHIRGSSGFPRFAHLSVHFSHKIEINRSELLLRSSNTNKIDGT